MTMIINIDVMLAKRNMSVTELAEEVGIMLANLLPWKNGKVKAICRSTLEGICEALDCQPGAILEHKKVDKTDIESDGNEYVYLFKVARMTTDVTKDDNYVRCISYLAIGAELETRGKAPYKVILEEQGLDRDHKRYV